jgi:hypothetical protein
LPYNFSLLKTFSMKKTALLITICLFCATTWAQDTTTHLPKFRITKGVLSTKYELGDKDVDAKQVRIHLEKHSPESYYQWRKAESATTTAAVLLVVGLGCGIGALVSSDQTTQIALY